ncbi:DMT family transporter [Gluconacetobacter takamatsuzukensis]|uniref:DMT family transporter n=1 Tax=Gluconacetobacter takamatsuzukensis TaxID=1286190 RepID=A0A7W4KBH2_9PROT|nr:DMT family transporter [Gluconacetobacter takamatsuzukensis]MBB2203871.1 DMT family transporter [Gluconacetobacter takamatsuzukensis]
MGLGYGVAAGAFWALGFLAPALAADFTPLQVSIGRYLAYGAFSVLALAPRWPAVRATIGGREIRALFALGLLGNILYYALLSYAVRLGGIAATSLIIGLLPAVLTVIGSRDDGAVSLRRLAPSLLFSLAAIGCIAWGALGAPGPAPRGAPVQGWLCAVGAMLSWAAYAVGNQRWLARLHHVSAQDWNLLTGSATGILAVLVAGPAFLLGAPGAAGGWDWARFAAVAAGTGFLVSIVGNVFWNRMSRLLPLTLAGQMILFETLFALLYGFLWEQRLPTGIEIAAMLLVCAGVLSGMAVHRPSPGMPAPEPS